jgi:hypothetical protein
MKMRRKPGELTVRKQREFGTELYLRKARDERMRWR